jgi:hypothetical protein
MWNLLHYHLVWYDLPVDRHYAVLRELAINGHEIISKVVSLIAG